VVAKGVIKKLWRTHRVRHSFLIIYTASQIKTPKGVAVQSTATPFGVLRPDKLGSNYNYLLSMKKAPIAK